MDELIQEKQMGGYLTRFPLNIEHKIMLIRCFGVDEGLNERYLLDLLIMCGEELITANTTDSIQFCEELALFDRGDENNKFLKPAQLQAKNSLKLSLDNGKVIFIKRSEAKTMVKLWDMSLQRLTFARLVENENISSKADWCQKLYEQEYIAKETYDEMYKHTDHYAMMTDNY